MMLLDDEDLKLNNKIEYIFTNHVEVTPVLGSPAARPGSTDIASPSPQSKSTGCDGQLDESSSDVTTNRIERGHGRKFRYALVALGKVCCALGLLYVFVCSLDLLSSAFRLLGGRTAGAAFSHSKLLQNPITGLMVGVLATVLVQSSSTSSSIIVAMVASGIVPVRPAIPVIMGANIGTSLTNTIVSLAQSTNRDEFRRSFAGATVHDMFNWLTVIVLLPTEVATGYLYHLTSFLLSSLTVKRGMSVGNHGLLQKITKPLTKLIVQLDKKVIEGIAVGDATCTDKRLLKEWCGFTMKTQNMSVDVNTSSLTDMNSTLMEVIVTVPTKPCVYLFHDVGLSDAGVGSILLVFSLLFLCGSLVLTVKLLNSSLRGSVLSAVQRTVNAQLPGRAACLTGYVAMVVGAALTLIVQSSSVFTSVLTPLVGVGVVTIERMYPLTLGANIGTTTTSVLASLAAPADRLSCALQVALCHLFFNLSGIMLFYPVPKLRLPIQLARQMGNTTAQYRWFAVFYALMMFVVVPVMVLALSMAGYVVITTVISVLLTFISVVVIINVLQRYKPHWLPVVLRNWSFLPLCMRSLEPADRVVTASVALMRRTCCCCWCCCHMNAEETSMDEEEMKEMNSSNNSAENSDSGIESLRNSEDACDIVVVESDSSSEKMLEELTETVSTQLKSEDVESGYWSAVCTPASSRLPSYAGLPFISETPDTPDIGAT